MAEARCPWSVISYGPPLPLRPLLLDLAAADAARLIDLVLDEPATCSKPSCLVKPIRERAARKVFGG